MVPITYDGGYYWKDFLNSSANPLYRQLAEITLTPEDKKEWLNLITETILRDGTNVFIGLYIRPSDGLDPADFYTSKDILSLFGGLIVNMKWPLSEKLAQHILRYQQVQGHFCILSDI